MQQHKHLIVPLMLSLTIILSCSPQPGPDKTAVGAVLGAGWGAGAGAIVGNQVGSAGGGTAVGAGVGAVAGMAAGLGYDIAESGIYDTQEELERLRRQTEATAKEIKALQLRLDRMPNTQPGIYLLFFDEDETSFRSGTQENLEQIAIGVRQNPAALKIKISTHAAEVKDQAYNLALAEKRGQNVAEFFAAQGIGRDRIVIENKGTTRPIATNATADGRKQNSRVEIVVMR